MWSRELKDTPVASGEHHHPFGGCNRLMGHYQMVGAAFLGFERKRVVAAFREAISFVPVEVLESYLEDLLDPEIKEETLFIARERSWFHSLYIPLLGLSSALAGGTYLVSTGIPAYASLGLVAFLALPFAVLIHLFPRSGLTRRMQFAQVLSAEISRRRGREDKDVASWPSRLIFGEVFPSKSRQLPGAARVTYH